MKIFLICGSSGVGKSTAASIIQSELKNSIKTSLSKYIKLYAKEMGYLYGTLDKTRKILQEIGDNLRKIDEDFLINRIIEDFKVYKSIYNNVIIDDIRLINEIDKLKSLKDYEVIAIKIFSKESRKKLTIEEQNHHTEKELENYDRFDYIIENNFDEDFEKNIKEILKGFEVK